MLATVTNLSATDEVEVPAPFNVTIAASGNVVRGVNLADLNGREDTGNPHWKVLNDMIKKGQISITYADDAATRDTYDRARNA